MPFLFFFSMGTAIFCLRCAAMDGTMGRIHAMPLYVSIPIVIIMNHNRLFFGILLFCIESPFTGI